jgi:DNA-binding CsgD family transcriptional regulator
VTPGAAAADLLTGAAQRYGHLGAYRDRARAEARLRALGVRRRPGRTRAPAAHGWDGLTETERTVVALTAQGLTNREIATRLFVSPRTVETHLTHVFAKLDLTGRSALRDAVAARTYGGVPDVPRGGHDQHRMLPAHP